MSTPHPYNIPPEPIPRQLNDLFTERNYLISALQDQNIESTDLLRRITTLQEWILGTEHVHQKIKARKQIGWLKYRLGEAARQANTISQRLAQLTSEIQSRESWTALEDERRWLEQCQQLRSGIPGLQLSPTTTECQTQNHSQNLSWQVQEPQWRQLSWQQQYQQLGYGGFSWQPSLQDYTADLPAENNTGEEIRFHLPFQQIPEPSARLEKITNAAVPRYLLHQRSFSLSDADLDALKTKTEYLPIPKVKRLSLPLILGTKNVWGPTVEEAASVVNESTEWGQYLGFYVKK